MDGVQFDDVEGLNARAGELGSWSAPMAVTQEMIDRFADLTGDHQWIHVDVERSRRESPFGGPVAHGFLTLSLIPHLLPKERPMVTGHRNAVNYGSDKLRFVAPVPAGSQVRVRSRLLGAEAKPKGTLVTREIEVEIVDAQRPALVYAMQTLYMG